MPRKQAARDPGPCYKLSRVLSATLDQSPDIGVARVHRRSWAGVSGSGEATG